MQTSEILYVVSTENSMQRSAAGVNPADEILEAVRSNPANLPVVEVPVAIDVPVVKQPTSSNSVTSNPIGKAGKISRRSSGLACLAVTDSIIVYVEKSCRCCGWEKKYIIKDASADESLMFEAREELHGCRFSSLQNILIRDVENVPVAGIRYKEKSCFISSMALGVYAPPDVLIGTAEESTRPYLLSSEFKLRNSDGDHIFYVTHNRSLGSSNFSVNSAEHKEIEVAKILEKTKSKLRIHFLVKLSITAKTILLGFCVGTLHKSCTQQANEQEH